jgi:N-acetylneuraminic acid mutarotase
MKNFILFIIIGLQSLPYLLSGQTEQWQHVTTYLNNEGYEVAATSLNNKIYITGGIWGGGPIRRFLEYDIISNVWTVKPSLLIAVCSPMAAICNNKLYVLGGTIWNYDIQSAEVCTFVQEYDFSSNSWSLKSNIIQGVQNTSVAVVNNKIFVIGGNSSIDGNTVQEYDPINDTCILKSEMPTSRGGSCACVVDDKIYVIGGDDVGWNELNAVEMYDPVTDIWVQKDTLLSPRTNGRCGVINNKIYFFGGGIFGPYDENEEYDPQTNKWQTKLKMITGRYAFGVATVNNEIYAIGGRTNTIPDNILIEKYFISYDDIYQSNEGILGIQIYPNPVRDKITIDNLEKRNLKVTVYNLIGELVLSRHVRNSRNEIEVSNLQNGMYLIKIESTQRSIQQKFIKE